MSGNVFHISYNAPTYRWEIWRSGARLPDSTHPSRDAAVLLALDGARHARRARVLVFDEKGAAETVLDVRNAGIRPARSLASFHAGLEAPFGESQPSKK